MKGVVGLVAVAAAVAVASVAAQGGPASLPFVADFSQCAAGSQPDVSMWQVLSMQWGGKNVNGGVAPGNVQCVQDAQLGKPVLQFTAHGDNYTGAGPTGVLKNGSPRPNNAEFTGWINGGYKNPCTPHCDVRRVGGGLQSRDYFSGGHLTVMMKPCKNFGVASATWIYNYTEEYCDTSSSTCSPAYQSWCCGGKPCTAANDVCQGAWYKNLEIDIEQPTSDTGVAPRAYDPDWITFHNMRFSSYTALKSSPHDKCGSVSPCSEEDYEYVGTAQNDGQYHKYEMIWDTTNYNVTFLVDGQFKTSIMGANKVPEMGHLWIGAWFPNSWAGSPNFDTCTMSVASLRIDAI